MGTRTRRCRSSIRLGRSVGSRRNRGAAGRFVVSRLTRVSRCAEANCRRAGLGRVLQSFLVQTSTHDHTVLYRRNAHRRGGRRVYRTGTARPAARSAHGNPSRLLSVAGVSCCLTPQFCAGTSGTPHPSYGAHDIASRRALGRSTATERSTATDAGDAYRSWRGGRLVDGRANTVGVGGPRVGTSP
jgi:hypothetical protein